MPVRLWCEPSASSSSWEVISHNLLHRPPFVHASRPHESDRSLAAALTVLTPPLSKRFSSERLRSFPVDVRMPVWQVRSAGGGVFGLPCGGKIMIKSELVARLA